MRTHPLANACISAPPHRSPWLLGLICACSLLGASSAQAQTVYRIVGPDGKVSFSDKPPVTTTGKVNTVDKPAGASGVNTSALPYELRQVATKYPVTLYTGKDCAPCDSGRSLLKGRGIPFTEKTVSSAQDVEALQRLSGNTSLPFLTIGGQHVAGYASTEWTQYLDAAGYPASSKLPASYRAPEPSPLVAPEKPADTQKAASNGAPTAPPPIPVKPNPGNPAGIQF